MSKKGIALGFVILLGVLVKISLIFGSDVFLVSNLLPDDAFYYFKTAEHIALGNGSTFDGLHPANGYHPLWMILITPFFFLFNSEIIGNMDPVRASLLLSVAFDIGSVLLLLVLMRRITHNVFIQGAGVLFWIFNPFVIYETLSGLETALSVFLILSTLVSLIYAKEKGGHWFTLLGISGGLMMLARLDNLFYFFAVLCAVFFFAQKRIQKVIHVGLVATLVVLPWLVWNVSQFGSILTSSSAAFTMYQHNLIVQDHGPSILQKIKAAVYMAEHGFQTILAQTGAPVMFLLILGMALCLYVKERLINPRVMFEGVRHPEWYFFFASVALFFLHTVIRLGYRTWYFVPFNIFFALLIVWVFEKLSLYTKTAISEKGKTILSAVLVVFLLFSFFVSWSQELRNREKMQIEMMRMAEWANDNLPEQSRIGVFNSGVQGYFSKHTIINLDGLINTHAYEAMKKRDLWSYIESSDIDYVSDFDIYMTYRYKAFLGVRNPFDYLEFVHAISIGEHGRSGSRGGIQLSKVLPRNNVSE